MKNNELAWSYSIKNLLNMLKGKLNTKQNNLIPIEQVTNTTEKRDLYIDAIRSYSENYIPKNVDDYVALCYERAKYYSKQFNVDTDVCLAYENMHLSLCICVNDSRENINVKVYYTSILCNDDFLTNLCEKIMLKVKDEKKHISVYNEVEDQDKIEIGMGNNKLSLYILNNASCFDMESYSPLTKRIS